MPAALRPGTVWTRSGRTLWLAGLIWAFATGLAAQTVPVRSGEHPGYSRLALFIGEAGWRLGRSPEGYTLAVEQATGFETDGVFDLIPRSRITALRQDGEQLRIDIVCDCHAIAFPWRETWLIVDVRDGAAPAGSPFETPFDGSQQAVAPTAMDIPLLIDAAPPALPLPDPFLEPDRPDSRVDDVRLQMAEGLAEAAAQGLLDLAVPMRQIDDLATDAPPSVDDPPAETAPPTAAPAASAPPPPEPGRPGILARTSMDSALATLMPSVENAADRCLPDSAFDLAAWAGTGDFGAEIASRRAALTTDTGVIPPGAPEDLARTQLAFGFTIEARQTLDLDDRQSQERDRLRVLSLLIDAAPVPPDTFADQSGCTGDVALWAALARGGLAGTTEVERIAVTQAFRRLPAVLQGLIGPRLAGYYIDSGDPAGAAMLLAKAESTDVAEESAVGLAAARLETAAGDAEGAFEELESLADEDARLGPEGVIALVDLAIAGNALPDEGLLSLLRTLRFEYRNRAEDADLGLAEARLLTASGRYAEAAAIGAVLPQTGRDRAMTDLLQSAASQADDATFLDIAFSDIADTAGPAGLHAVAARLIDLGFPERALDLLSAPVTGETLLERRYLRATAAAALGRPDLVEAELLGLDDDRARELRQSLVAPGAADQVSAAWRTGDWDALGTQPDALLQAAAQAMTTPAPDLSAGTPLATREALIADAEETRRIARELLDRFAAQPPAEGDE